MPEQFQELCFKIGLAVIQGQKVQFALAYFYSVSKITQHGWTKEQGQQSIDFHLSKPMGVVVTDIEKQISVDSKILQRIKDFKDLRNWLAHDFDQESTSFLRKGERLADFTLKMDHIINESVGLMQDLDILGEMMCPTRA